MAYRTIGAIALTSILVCATALAPTRAQIPGTAGPAPTAEPQAQLSVTLPFPPQISPDLTQLQTDLKKLQSDLITQRTAQDIIKWYAEVGAAVVTILGVFIAVAGIGGLILQGYAFRVEARIRTHQQDEEARARVQFHEENAKQAARENSLNERYVRLLDLVSGVAEQAQKKVAALEEGELGKAGVTLNLINSLLEVTARTALRASETEHNIIQREIANKDEECRSLIGDSLKEEERAIIAKPEFRNRLMVLSKDIDGLAAEIKSYNRSQGNNFMSSREAQQGIALALSAPCLFVRGQQFNVDQNFPEAIKYWNDSLTAEGKEAVIVDANYWIAYTRNTLGQFPEALRFLNNALGASPGDRKPELSRLQLETQFFALGLQEVPDHLFSDGLDVFKSFPSIHLAQTAHQRAVSSFAATMGNMRMIKWVRATIAGNSDPEGYDVASDWFQKAITAAEGHARWAAFGLCQTLSFKGDPVNDTTKSHLRYIIKSVNDEYTRRDRQPRSQLLCKATEYYCIRMLGDDAGHEERDALPGIAQEVQRLGAGLEERFIYSQFRKQNVDRDAFFSEFNHFKKSEDIAATMKFANTATKSKS